MSWVIWRASTSLGCAHPEMPSESSQGRLGSALLLGKVGQVNQAGVRRKLRREWKIRVGRSIQCQEMLQVEVEMLRL